MTKLEKKVIHEALIWHAAKVIEFGGSKGRPKEDRALSRACKALLKG